MSVLIPKVVFALATAKATILVVDEEGIPLEGINTGISFSKPMKKEWGSTSAGNRGLTSKDGLYTSSGSTEKIIRYGARHPDYYTSMHKFTKFTGVSGILGFRKWQPWNPTLKVVLKKKQNPIPMYVYFTDWFEIPKKDDVVGYDLVKHDWVSPYGKGVVADFLFKLSFESKGKKDDRQDLSLSFTNAKDGIQIFKGTSQTGSELRSQHHAPNKGYEGEIEHYKERRPGQRAKLSFHSLDGTNYYFRVRCSNEDVNRCLYGKIYENIEFSGVGETRLLKFKYYLNSTPGDTNVEFDPKQNLFDDVRSEFKP
jgi:hypothetical protein